MRRDEWQRVRAALRAGPCATPGCSNSVNRIDKIDPAGQLEPGNLVGRCAGCASAMAKGVMPERIGQIAVRPRAQRRLVRQDFPWLAWGR